MEIKPLSQRERIEKLTLRLNITRRELARIAELGEDTIYHAGDETRKLTERTASKICYHVERKKGVVVNRDWLLTGIGDMIDEKLSTPYQPTEQPMQSAAEEAETYGNTHWRSRYFELLDQHLDLQRKYTALLEKNKEQ